MSHLKSNNWIHFSFVVKHRKSFKWIVLLFTGILLLGNLRCTEKVHEVASGNDNILDKLVDSQVYPVLDSILQDAISNGLIPGAVLSINQNGKSIYEKAFGFAHLNDFDRSPLTSPELLTTTHRFDLASLTKVFATTFGVMILLDQQEIELDKSLSSYLPEFAGQNKDSITIRHLLSHSAGLYPWKPTYYHSRTKATTYTYISQLPLAYPVGKERHYSDLGFMLLGYLIERISGENLNSFLQKQLYTPLGLKYTAFNPPVGAPPFAATSHGNPFEERMVSDDDFGYICDEEPGSFTDWRPYTLLGEVNDGNAFHANGGEAGHAGLFSTSSELQILLQLLLNEGVHKEMKIINKETIKNFLTKNQFGHGLGWAMSDDVLPVTNLPKGAFGHTGFTGTFAIAIPDKQLSIILLTNRQNLGVNEDGSYNSLTDLRRKVVDAVVE